MSLFGDLPPPTSHLRTKQELEEEYKPRPLPATDPLPKTEPEDANDEDSPDRPDKRRRVDTAIAGGLSNAQIAAALAKIASHIGNPDKFPKASGLLRQLLESGALSRVHRDQLFEAAKAAFADFDNASEASLRRDYMKLCHALCRVPDSLFSRPQRAQLEVYNIVGFVQNEMHTDDSFVFNKVLGRIKEAVSELPPATEEDEEALAELQGPDRSSSGSEEEGQKGEVEVEEVDGDSARRRRRSEGDGEGPDAGTVAGPLTAAVKQEAVEIKQEQDEAMQRAAEAPPAPQRHEAEVDEGDMEADPFGLDQLLPAPKLRPPPPPPPPPPPSQPTTSVGPAGSSGRDGGTPPRGSSSSSIWTAAQSLVMRRQALIECLITARGFHKTPWARTSVELLVEHYHKHRDRFTVEQQVAVGEMVRFVRQARQARPTGPSQKEINRDTTSFERARSEWSRMHVSARGKVGAQGDAKSQNWLG